MQGLRPVSPEEVQSESGSFKLVLWSGLICSQCDGSSPCSRCKADNAICVFGERKKSHDKVYPKG